MKYLITKNKYLTPDESTQLLATLKDDRDGNLIRLALLTGARASELLNIKTQDLSENSVLIFGLKNSDDREIPIPSDLAVSLKNQSKNKKLFDISYQRLNQIWQMYRPNNKTFHSLRHTYAMRLYDTTKDLLLVQQALGHRAIQNTTVYARASDSQNKLRAAINGLY
jgi:integrase